MGKRHDDRLGVRIKRNGESSDRDGNGKIKCLDMTAKRLRQCMKKPLQRKNSAAFLASLMDFPVGARHETFEIAARGRLGGERRNFRQVGGGLLVKQMKALE